jgi:hypothetical protein
MKKMSNAKTPRRQERQLFFQPNLRQEELLGFSWCLGVLALEGVL